MSNFNIHHTFKLQGQSFDSPLALIAYSEKVSDPLFWFLQEWFSDSETLIVKTSGSTGAPKLVAINKEYMENSAKATAEFLNIKENTKALCCLSTDYIAGKMMVIRALTLGWHLDVVDPKSNPLTDIDIIYDFCAMVPLQAKASLQNLNQVKKLLIGGGAVSPLLYKELSKSNATCYISYGMTETVSHIALHQVNNNITLLNHYKLLPNIAIEKDERGCLVIIAPLLSDDTITTNDLVNLHDTKEFEWLGRFDNVINSGGIKIHPEQLERKLSVKITDRFFVAGISDSTLGEKLILIVEGAQKNIDFDGLALSKYETPKEVYFTANFIETETQKIQRQKTLNAVLNS